MSQSFVFWKKDVLCALCLGERWVRGKETRKIKKMWIRLFFFFFFPSGLVYCLFFQNLSSMWKLLILNIYSWMREWVNWNRLLKKQQLDIIKTNVKDRMCTVLAIGQSGRCSLDLLIDKLLICVCENGDGGGWARL